jgi:hypothetical protein
MSRLGILGLVALMLIGLAGISTSYGFTRIAHPDTPECCQKKEPCCPNSGCCPQGQHMPAGSHCPLHT